VLRGDDIQPHHLDKLYRFYVSTIDRKWGAPYLTESFFPSMLEAMGDRVVLIIAEDKGEPIAGALNLLGKHALYGRYWGSEGRYRFLHFELCYHQAVELAIELGIERVEAGAQGQHKIQRGYAPVKTFSAHFLRHDGLHGAVAEFLAREQLAIDHEIAMLRAESPFQADRSGTSVAP
jgi:predicted N-acyltransferase